MGKNSTTIQVSHANTRYRRGKRSKSPRCPAYAFYKRRRVPTAKPAGDPHGLPPGGQRVRRAAFSSTRRSSMLLASSRSDFRIINRFNRMNDSSHKLAGEKFTELVKLIARLRAPGGCPWDREQTHESLKPMLLEEAYEVIEAIDDGNDDELIGELGDLLLQVVFHADLAAEENRFTVADVIER